MANVQVTVDNEKGTNTAGMAAAESLSNTHKDIEVDKGTNYAKMNRTANKTYKQAKKDSNAAAKAMNDDMVYAEETLIQSAVNGQWPSFADAWKAVDAEFQHKLDALKTEVKGAFDILTSARNVAKTNLETSVGEVGLDIKEGLNGKGLKGFAASTGLAGAATLATSVACEVFEEDAKANAKGAEAGAKIGADLAENYSDFLETGAENSSEQTEAKGSEDTKESEESKNTSMSYGYV